MRTLCNILTLFFVCLIHDKALSQVKAYSDLKNCVTVDYYNNSNEIAYYTRPDFFLFQKTKVKSSKHYVRYFIRNDMYSLSNDTLTLYFTDTTLRRYSEVYRINDSFHTVIGLPKIDSLKKYEAISFKICFPRIKYYKHLLIKYNFGYNKDDFFNNVGIPVKELYLKSPQ